MSDADEKWEWTSDEIKRVGYRVIDIIAEHLSTLPSRPVFQPMPQTLVGELAEESVPVRGQ